MKTESDLEQEIVALTAERDALKRQLEVAQVAVSFLVDPVVVFEEKYPSIAKEFFATTEDDTVKFWRKTLATKSALAVQKVAAIEKQVEMWIPVGERLPEEGEAVLIWLDIPDYLYGWDSAKLEGKKWVALDSECFHPMEHVTHWMIPVKPEREKMRDPVTAYRSAKGVIDGAKSNSQTT